MAGNEIDKINLRLIGLGTCSPSSLSISNSSITIPNVNSSVFDFECGFRMTETENHVTFSSEIFYVQKAAANPWGIITANNFQQKVFTQNIECTFNKDMSAHAHALAKFSPDCEECANCSPADPACGNKKHSTLKMIGQLSKKIEI